MSRTRRRSKAAVGVAVAVAVALGLGLGVTALAWPPDQTARAADVVFVIGPPTDARIELAEALVAEHGAQLLLVSTTLPEAAAPRDTGWPKPDRPAWAQGEGSSVSAVDELCERSDWGGVGVLCLQPEPFTTQGEARALAALMKERGFETATVVTMTPHVARTRLLVDRCDEASADVHVIGVDEGLDAGGWAWQLVYQAGGFVKAVMTPGC